MFGTGDRGMGQLISVWIILIFQETGLIQMLSLAGLETKNNIIFRFNRRDLLTCDPFWEQSTVLSQATTAPPAPSATSVIISRIL